MMFEHLFIAHFYTSFGKMSIQRCHLLRFSCIHKFLFVECPKTLNHKDGGGGRRAPELRGGRGRGEGGLEATGHEGCPLSPSWHISSSGCGHVLFRDFPISCILRSMRETGRACGWSPSECPWPSGHWFGIWHLSFYLSRIVLASLRDKNDFFHFEVVEKNQQKDNILEHMKFTFQGP